MDVIVPKTTSWETQVMQGPVVSDKGGGVNRQALLDQACGPQEDGRLGIKRREKTTLLWMQMLANGRELDTQHGYGKGKFCRGRPQNICVIRQTQEGKVMRNKREGGAATDLHLVSALLSRVYAYTGGALVHQQLCFRAVDRILNYRRRHHGALGGSLRHPPQRPGLERDGPISSAEAQFPV